MLRKHEPIWSGQVGDIKGRGSLIDLQPDDNTFKSPQYCAVPKTRELAKSEINRQLTVGLIELATSEWAAPVLPIGHERGPNSLLYRLYNA